MSSMANTKSVPVGQKTKSGTVLLAAMLLGSAVFLDIAGTNAQEPARSASGVPYVSGGVGAESIERMTALAKDFNLKLVFALKSGEYASDVKVVVTDAAGKLLLDTTSEGPWLLARLPVGSYQISATTSGTTIRRNVTIDRTKLKTVDFRWTSG